MDAARAFERMCQLDLADWPAVAFGWARHWIGKNQLATWAASWLLRHREDEGIAEVELARAEALEDSEVSALLDQIVQRTKTTADQSASRWRLAMLIDLAESTIGWDEKVTELEAIAAEYAYPADMRDCTRYGPAGVDPLDAMKRVIEGLKRELGVASRMR